jgi:hypothetical protein
MPLTAATGTMHVHTTSTNPEKPDAPQDASQTAAEEEAVHAQAPPQAVLRGNVMPTDAEKTWNDRADQGVGRVSRSKRAAGYEERRQVAPERREGTGYETTTDKTETAKAVKSDKNVRKAVKRADR